jgi:hypothetical protein
LKSYPNSCRVNTAAFIHLGRIEQSRAGTSEQWKKVKMIFILEIEVGRCLYIYIIKRNLVDGQGKKPNT